MNRIGFIGGSGLYQLEGVKIKEELRLKTPYGDPSDKFILAESDGREIVFLPRHDRAHRINPSSINYRANIYGMKKLDVGCLISVTACGSLKEEIKPMDFSIPLQFIDRTNQARKCTFFDEGVVAHISFANPICKKLAALLKNSAQECGVTVHYGGTYLNMEGPQFSTQAESHLYRSWGSDIIGMTNMTEARLAREAEICYATLAAVTDFDCWYPGHENVTVDMVMENLSNNVLNSKKIIKSIITKIPDIRDCGCKDALECAIVTRPEAISKEIRKKMDIIIGRYMP